MALYRLCKSVLVTQILKRFRNRYEKKLESRHTKLL